MRVSRIRGQGASTPRCVAHVHVSKVNTLTRRIRAQKQEIRGLPIDVCGNYATHMLDDLPFCAAHAGQRALRHLEKFGK